MVIVICQSWRLLSKPSSAHLAILTQELPVQFMSPLRPQTLKVDIIKCTLYERHRFDAAPIPFYKQERRSDVAQPSMAPRRLFS